MEKISGPSQPKTKPQEKKAPLAVAIWRKITGPAVTPAGFTDETRKLLELERPLDGQKPEEEKFNTVREYLDHLSKSWIRERKDSNSSSGAGTGRGDCLDDVPDDSRDDRQDDVPDASRDDRRDDFPDDHLDDRQDEEEDSRAGDFSYPDQAGGPDTPSVGGNEDDNASVSDSDLSDHEGHAWHACRECRALGYCQHCGQPLPKRRALAGRLISSNAQ